MRVVGRDYILKIADQEFYDSVFNIRKRYFMVGKPTEIGRGNTVLFVMKRLDAAYIVVGDGKVSEVRRLEPFDKDYTFASEYGWKFVVEFEELHKYPVEILADSVFSSAILDKISSQRPFGIDLLPEESQRAKQKIDELLTGVS